MIQRVTNGVQDVPTSQRSWDDEKRYHESIVMGKVSRMVNEEQGRDFT
jgi:hypothetical protein